MEQQKKYTIREAVIVEGKYDKIRLSSFLSGMIVETNGFGIFQDKEKREWIRKLAKERGVVILTDSDGAGQLIRGYLSSSLSGLGMKHAFIPQLEGREKRKATPSKEGTLGVEGMETQVLLKALRQAGVTLDGESVEQRGTPITRLDLYRLGVTGGAGSKALRQALLCSLDLPRQMSPSLLLSALNGATDLEALEQWVTEYRREDLE